MVKTSDPKAFEKLNKKVGQIQTWIDRTGQPMHRAFDCTAGAVKDIDKSHGVLEKRVADVEKLSGDNKAWIDRNVEILQGYMDTAAKKIEKLESRCATLEKALGAMQKELATLKKKAK